MGPVPALPPAYVADVTAATSATAAGTPPGAAERADVEALQRRRDEIDDEVDDLTHELSGLSSPHDHLRLTDTRERLLREREVIIDSLDAIEHLTSSPPVDSAEQSVETEDELALAMRRARDAISAAQEAMRLIPAIAREALFQYSHNGQPLTVGGSLDRFTIEDAIPAEENGYLSWVEDEEQTVTPRRDNPRVGAAADALQRVRDLAFGGVSWKARAHAAPWARLLLSTEYGVDDPEFEVRPVWVQLGFIDQ